MVGVARGYTLAFGCAIRGVTTLERKANVRRCLRLGVRWGRMAHESTKASGSDYRRVAAECLRLIGQVDDPVTKANLISVAASWHLLAEFAEKALVVTDPSSDNERSGTTIPSSSTPKPIEPPL